MNRQSKQDRLQKVRSKKPLQIQVEVRSETSIDYQEQYSHLSGTLIQSLQEQENRPFNNYYSKQSERLQNQIDRLKQQKLKDQLTIKEYNDRFKHSQDKLLAIERCLIQLKEQNQALRINSSGNKQIYSLQVKLSSLQSTNQLLSKQNQQLKSQLNQRDTILKSISYDQSKQQIKAFQQHLQKLSQELSNQRQLRRHIQSQYDKSYTQYETDLTKLQQLLNMKDDQISNIRSEYTLLQLSNKEVRSLKQQMVRLKQNDQTQKNLINQLQGKIKNLQFIEVNYNNALSSIRTMQARLQIIANENKNNHSNQFTSLMNKVEMLKKQNLQLQQQISNQKNQKKIIQQQFIHKKQQLKNQYKIAHQKTLHQFNQQNISHQKTIQQLHTIQKALSQEKSSLQNKLLQYQQLYNSAKPTYQANNKLLRSQMDYLLEIQNLKSQLSQQQSHCQDLNGELEILQLRVTQAEKALTIQQSRHGRDRDNLLQQQEDIIKSHGQAIKNKDNEYRLLAKQKHNIENDRNEMEQKSRKLQLKVIQTTQLNNQLSKRINNINKQLGLKYNQLQQANSLIQNLKQQNQSKSQQCVKYINTISKLTQQTQKLRQSIQTTRKDWETHYKHITTKLSQNRIQKDLLEQQFKTKSQQLKILYQNMFKFIQHQQN